MHERSVHRGLTLGVFLVTVALCSGVAAQEEPAAVEVAGEPSPDEERVRALIIEAVADYDAHDYDEALATFETALVIRPSARVHRGIGMCLFEQRRYAEAIAALDRALGGAVDPLDTELREQVSALRERASRYVGRLSVGVTPDGAELLVDGRAVEIGRELTLDAGEHTVVASAPGHHTELREVRIDAGRGTVLSLSLAVEVPVIVDVPGASGGDRGIAWTVAGIATGIVGLGGVIGGAAWLSNREAAVGICAAAVAAGTECQNASTIVFQRDLAGATLGISAALLAAGATLLVVGAMEGAAPPAVACAGSVEGMGCSWRGTW
jgi:hypothetical protein